MGCNEDQLIRVARETGIPISNMAAWDNSSVSGENLWLFQKKLVCIRTPDLMGRSYI